MLTVKLLLVATVPLTVATICLAKWVLVLVFGAEYEGAARTLGLLAASLPLHAINGAIGQSLQAGHQQVSMMRIVTMGLAAHMVGIVVFIRLYGIEGAAVSVLVSSTLVTLGSFWAFHRNVAALHVGPRSLFTGVAVIAPIAVSLATPSPWQLPVGLLAGAVFTVVALFGVVTRLEREKVVRAVRPVRESVSP